jgi:alanine-glyoxylate transaminase/serine-glyoxylate transaminase/serine-pyruvate transaminase
MSKNSFKYEHKVLMGPGPTNVDNKVKKALSSEPISHLDSEFFEILDNISSSLRKVFKTKNKVTFAVSGTGSSGMEMAMTNLIESGDEVLILKKGVFGERMENLALRLSGKVATMSVPWGHSFDQNIVIEKIKSMPNLKLVCVVQAETSTGILQEIDLIGDYIKSKDIIFLVDAVTSLTGINLEVDSWGIDCCFSGTQKCISVPPGLSPITFSEKAIEKINKRKNSNTSWYFDLKMLVNYWGDSRVYHHTAPVNMLFALNEGLNICLEEGLEERFLRHQNNSYHFGTKLEEAGLKSFVDEQKFKSLPMLKSVVIPEGVDDSKIRTCLLSDHGIEIGGGLGATKGKIWRIGIMGFNSRKELIDDLFSKLSICLN